MIVYLLDARLQLRRDRAARRVRAGVARRARADRPVADVALLRATWSEAEIADEVAEAVERLSRSGIGAIIAIEREVSLDEYVQSGSEMQAKVSADLLATIFTPYSPLHDGAVIIRGDTIVGAGCILPLSQAAIIDRSLGTRHRAALGLSEETDALVVVVSEETATITVAANGRLWRDFDAAAGARPRRGAPAARRRARGSELAVRVVTRAPRGARSPARDRSRRSTSPRSRRASRSGTPASSSPPRTALGIPHPPGTPLFVVLLNAWATLLCLSAVRRRDESVLGGVHGGGRRSHGAVDRASDARAAGSDSPRRSRGRDVHPSGRTRRRRRSTRRRCCSRSRRSSRADRAGRTGDASLARCSRRICSRSRCPLHVSALVAAPVAVLSGGAPARRRLRLAARRCVLAGVSVATAGVGRMSRVGHGAGLSLILLAAVPRREHRRAAIRAARRVGVAIAAVAVGSSRCSARLLSPHPRAIRSGDQPGQSAHVEPARVRDRATPVRRRRALASPRRRSGCSWRTGSSTRTGSVGAVARARRRPERLARRSRRCLFAALGDRRRGVASAARSSRTWRAVASAVRLRLARRDRVPESQARGASFAWAFVPDDARARGARPRLLLRARLLGVGDLGRHGRGCAGAALRAPRAVGVAVAALPIASQLERRESPAGAGGEPAARVGAAAARAASAARRALRRRRQRHLSALVCAAGRERTPRRHRRDAAAARRAVVPRRASAPRRTRHRHERVRRRWRRRASRADALAQNRPVAAALTSRAERAAGDRETLEGRRVSWRSPSRSRRRSRTRRSTSSLDTAALRDGVARSIDDWRRGRRARDAPDSIHEYFLRAALVSRLACSSGVGGCSDSLLLIRFVTSGNLLRYAVS